MRKQALLAVVLVSILLLGAGCADQSAGEPVAPRASPVAFYVSEEGSDDADGRTADTAFRTIERAMQEVRPGDSLLILPGSYHEALYLEGLGSAQASITIRGEGGVAVLDGQRTMDIGFWCEGCANLVFENLEFRNYTDVGIGFYNGDDIVMRDLHVHHNGFDAQLKGWEIEGYGIHVDESQRITVEDCETHDNGPQPQVPDQLMGTGINTYMCTDCLIRNNESYDNIGGGILVEDGVNVLVEGNLVYVNDLDATAEGWWDGGLWVDGGHDITVRGNTFRDNLGPGIEISDEDDQQHDDIVIEDNTITGNYYGLYIWGFGAEDLPPERVLRLAGNEISGNAWQDVWVEP